MPIRQSWRTIVAAIVFISVAMFFLRWNGTDEIPGNEEEWTAPAVHVARERQPTIVTPSEDWMSGSLSETDASDEAYADTLDEADHDRPFLPPPLPHHESDVQTFRR